MTADPNLPSADSHSTPPAVRAPGDCGCGCGGAGGCGGAKSASSGSIREGRRKFLVGGIGVGAFAATLASRPAFAACQNLTGLYSPNGSQQTGVCGTGGKTPGFWANHLGCWPSGFAPTDTFSKWFGTFTFSYSTENLKTALCPPNGQDNLAFQIAAGLMNAASPQTNVSFGYTSAAAFAAAVIAAIKAVGEAATHDRLALMNSDNSNVGAWCSQQSVCSG